MPNGFLLSRALLNFQSDDDDLIAELSAVTRTPDGNLWLGSDEFTTLERLSPMGDGVYGNHKTFHLQDFIQLFDDESEIDIEGLDYCDGYLWVVGSHSFKRTQAKGKKQLKDIQRLSEIERDPNRSLLARLPILNGEIVPTYARSDNEGDTLTAASLKHVSGHNLLMEALAKDEHLGLFLKMQLPSKDNGFDVEGLAVSGSKIFLGLRGPVLRGWAIILEIEVEDTEPGVLTLKDLGEGCLYRKHFLDLNGQGIRELCLHEGDLLLLAGPTMELEGAMQMFRLDDVLEHTNDTLWSQDSGQLKVLFDLPFTIGSDHAEGLALVPCLGYDDGLMVVYDSPDDRRRPGPKAIFADIFRLPNQTGIGVID
ncbi:MULTISPECIES: DUF3616 domain-containing protein [Cyanophyceae]|uniref:DUF3616 domain-containing protein n=1 Tax=Cyanophyceae TaxID=3028117 RepID=UPI0016873B91|nr:MULTISPECIES: DUF3616 domain-containing protein [Cyanophyceae]MBD1915061.1 DUF3616 domain-containing protein [Phormidium sp. FACHB-77]MBD2030807.1 DUF3616 domain-containing protein [Phormidium sp. FACHB-322]MBD2053161.1 DUF3616 domain-containing protein [Leptolyngbya sp. FACHB-60]